MSAVISDCGLYRYRLERQVAEEGLTVMFIGVNPSTADASLDDATVRKWRGFSERMGARRFIVGNLFAYRSTDVKALAKADNPKGAENDAHLSAMAAEADMIVPCWGDSGKLPKRLRHRISDVRGLIRWVPATVKVFGLTASNDPKHPLMLGYATHLQDWQP